MDIKLGFPYICLVCILSLSRNSFICKTLFSSVNCCCLIATLISSEHHASNEDDVGQNADDDLERAEQQQQQQRDEASQDSSTAPEDVDAATDRDQLGTSEESRDDDEQQLQPQQQLQQVQRQQQVSGEDEQRPQLNDEEEGESESQNTSESVGEKTQQTVEETETEERQSLQQTNTAERPETSTANDSEVQKPSQDAAQTERRSVGSGRTQVESKTSTSPEKKQQQVAVVHAHERRPEDRALSRLRRDEDRMMFRSASVSRQPTMESHLSIESIESSSAQLSQASVLWRNDQSQSNSTARPPPAQDVNLQAQYEQLKTQLQQQLDLQRSQLEREYQLREEQMKQQMLMQWQYFTQQQQQQQQQSQRLPDVRQDTRRDSDPRSTTRVDRRTDAVAAGSSDEQQTAADGRQRCGCDDGVQPGDVRADAMQPGNATRQRNRHGASGRPVVVDVISRTRDRGRGRGAGPWPAGAHCRITLGTTTTHDELSDEDVESVDDPTGRGRASSSGAVEWRVCPTCGLCRHPCDANDGKRTLSESVTPATHQSHHAASCRVTDS